ncbi:MAG: hypothetical protein PV358_11970 [Acidimicrobiales bacterium]|nr:hypothetical protein [Acidimicrobiales bacterium]
MTDSPPDPQASSKTRVDEPTDPARATQSSAPAARGRLEVSGTQVAASVLASVSAAVVASFFGVAGTIVGAAVVSVVATIGSAAYSLGISRTQHRLQKLQELRPARPFPTLRAESVGGRDTDAGADADADREDAPVTVDGDGAREGGWRDWLAERRWGVAAGVALVFVISLASVTLLELAGDKALSRDAGGSARTSIGALFGDDDGGDDTGPGDDVDTEADDGSGGTVDRAPATPADPGSGGTTTSTQPGGTTSTTSTDPGADAGEPAPSTSTTSTTIPADPATPTTTVPDAQAVPPTTAAPAG